MIKDFVYECKLSFSLVLLYLAYMFIKKLLTKFILFYRMVFRTNTCVKRASALNKFNISHIHGFLQRVSSVQKVPDQLLCDGKVCWELGASFD